MGLFGGRNDAALTHRLATIERKLDAILASLGIAVPEPTYGPGGATLQSEALEEIRALAHSGKKIEAIKRLRELTGMGLKDAKDLIDAGL